MGRNKAKIGALTKHEKKLQKEGKLVYAGNTYPCPLGDAWWWSPGFGRDDCPEGGFFRRPARGDGVNGVR